MSSPKIPIHDPLDNFIGRCLKYWLWHQEPPQDSKEKLLQAAHRYSLEDSENIKLWQPFSHNLSLLFGKISSALSHLHVPSPGFVEMPFTENSMHRSLTTRETIFRSFPTRMEYFCLIS